MTNMRRYSVVPGKDGYDLCLHDGEELIMAEHLCTKNDRAESRLEMEKMGKELCVGSLYILTILNKAAKQGTTFAAVKASLIKYIYGG